MSKRTIKKIEKYEAQFKTLTDVGLRDLTTSFRARIANGEKLGRVMPEAFAVMKIAVKRILNLDVYPVQLQGAIVLSSGSVAEMKTGEGKTLTAIFALYLFALTRESVLLITTNDYLAKRDSETMRPVFELLGMSCSVRVQDESNNREKKVIYDADIVYVSNTVFGFDYLLENLVSYKDELYLRPLGYAVVDECDEVLLDSAQMPLVISGAAQVQSNLLSRVSSFISMIDDEKYITIDKEEKKVWLTQDGIDECEKYFRTESLFDGTHHDLVKQIHNALIAHFIYEKNVDYIIKNNELVLLNKTNGRPMKGTKLQNGLHQSLECKEDIQISPQSRAVASITYQTLFRKFKQISGMTGTGKVCEDEFVEVYNMAVNSIKPNRKVIRRDNRDIICSNFESKVNEIISLIIDLNQKGRPILVITESLEISKLYSNILINAGIKHQVLNALSKENEALIVSKAGEFQSITISTSMAGRGTDIKLDNKSLAAGGLAVIVSGHSLTRRSDLQIIGRSGRQGNPGDSYFVCALDDEIFEDYSFKLIRRLKMKYRKPCVLKGISYRLVKRKINKIQAISESKNKDQRINGFYYDVIEGKQRDFIYEYRRKILNDHVKLKFFNDLSLEIEFLLKHKDTIEKTRFITDNFDYEYRLKNQDRLIHTYLNDLIDSQQQKLEEVLTVEEIELFYKVIILKAIDECWVQHVELLKQLKQVVTIRSLAKRNPIYEFQKESDKLASNLENKIKAKILEHFLRSTVSRELGFVVSFH